MNINDIIIKPIITEKSSQDMTINKYTFEVHKNATKDEIKHAVQTIFAKSGVKGRVKVPFPVSPEKVTNTS